MATNPTNNRVSTTLAEEKLATINDLFKQLNAQFDFVVGLTADERQFLPKMNDGNQPFVEDAITGLEQTPDIFPAYIKADELQKDFTLYTQLGPMVMSVLGLMEKLLDTQMLAGSEAYVTALMIYRLAEAAAKAGLPGADTLYQKLRKRFAAQGTPVTPPATPPVA